VVECQSMAHFDPSRISLAGRSDSKKENKLRDGSITLPIALYPPSFLDYRVVCIGDFHPRIINYCDRIMDSCVHPLGGSVVNPKKRSQFHQEGISQLSQANQKLRCRISTMSLWLTWRGLV